MGMTTRSIVTARLIAMFTVAAPASWHASANDWPYWRGPEQTGMSREPSVVTSWSQDATNQLWKVPIGGRSTPILMDGRLYMIGPAGDGECQRERVVCLDADTGAVIWEHRFNVFHTDIVAVRLGWTAVVGDPETGNVYAHTTGGEMVCFNRDGKILWKHSLTEEFARSSGYGGRLHTPIIDEDRVIISMIFILTGWDTGKKKAGHRYLAFDKRTGEMVWWSQPGGKPLDTTYSVPAVAVIDGKRMLIAGNADGSAYGMMARTGEKVWSFKLSKRGLNTSIVVDGKYAYLSHSEENIEGTEMGSVVCLDASKTGDLAETGVVWRRDGLAVGYASPAIANGRLYVATNSANLFCLDAMTGEEYWDYNLGTAMKGSPTVTADGVIYVGDVQGRFHILKDDGDSCRSLDAKHLTRADGAIVELNGSPIVSNGRVYFMTAYHTYCLGDLGKKVGPVAIPPMPPETKSPEGGIVPVFRLVPAEVTLAPGESVKFETRMFDTLGRFQAVVGSDNAETNAFAVKGLNGTVAKDGTFTAGSQNVFSSGTVTFKQAQKQTAARIRISPKLPIHETFDGMKAGTRPPGWVGLDAKSVLVEKDGSVMLQKLAKSPSAKYMRMRSFSGPPLPANYTVEAEIMGQAKVGRRPRLPDMGLINCRYKLILLGDKQLVRLVSYSPIPRIQKDVPFSWGPDVWFQTKLRVEIKDGKGLIRGKVWPKDQPEPAAWTVEMVDPCPNLEGSPGLYGYSAGTSASKPGASVFYDNYRVYLNDE